ncbi:serine hydrolase domain-containing protein [Haloarcula mannanilytica]|nr:serine hydrolase domain-containing protein [Haloarcula mannanilytica]
MVFNGSPILESTIENLRSFLLEWMDRATVPGLSVAVFDNDAVRYAEGLGERNVDTHAPATPDTLYAVASLTKPFTAVAILQLVDRGLLNLDDKIEQYISVWTDVPGEPITVRDLLSHASGMPRNFVAYHDSLEDGQELDLLEHIDGAADQRLTDRPRYMYSNSGYFLLGEILQQVDGRAYPEYVRDELFSPLGMTRSTFDSEVLNSDDDTMTGYHQTEDGLEPGSVDDGGGPSGGLVSSVSELVPLLQCVLNEGSYDDCRLLSSHLVDEMCRLQSPPLPMADGQTSGYGYGWEVEEFLGETLVSHRGSIGISGRYMGVLRERGLGIMMAYNALGHPVVAVGKGALATACGEDRETVVPLLQQLDTVRSIEGAYTAYRGGMTVTIEQSHSSVIEVDISSPPLTFTATPESSEGESYRFSEVRGDGSKLIAEFDTKGSTTELILSLDKWTSRLTKGTSEQ